MADNEASPLGLTVGGILTAGVMVKAGLGNPILAALFLAGIIMFIFGLIRRMC